MSWLVVARKEFRDASRSYWLWGLSAVFVLLVSLVAAGVGYFFEEVTSSDVLFTMNGLLISTLVPLISLVMGFAAVSGERESGSLKLLLSLPHSRSDVVFGKFLGRASVMAAAIAVGFLLPAVVLAATVPFDAVEYVGYTLFVVVLAVVFVAIAVGISASVSSQWRAIALALGFYFVFVTFWVLFQGVGFFTMMLIAGEWPSWMPLDFQQTRDLFQVVNPSGSFKILTRAFLNDLLFAPGANDVQGMPNSNLQFSALTMLVFWLVFPLLVGIWRFEITDL